MKNLFKIRTLIFVQFIIVCSVFSLRALSIEAMTESDLDGVSAVAGDYILDIFGVPAAGLISEKENNDDALTSDSPDTILSEFPINNSELKPGKNEDGQSSTMLANEKIRTLENDAQDQNKLVPPPIVNDTSINDSIEENKQIIAQSNASTSNSEIRFKQGKFSHVMQELKNGGVSVIRDLTIDLLKIENIRFDEHTASAGNIYLSDWRSQGNTQMITHD